MHFSLILRNNQIILTLYDYETLSYFNIEHILYA